MKIAVVGSGISGLGAAWLLSREHEVTVFESNDYVGGHTHTHDITLGDRHYRVDTGFIVCNPDHYPHFFRMLGELGVETQDTTMSFAVRHERSDLEYNATDLDRLFVAAPRRGEQDAAILVFTPHDDPAPKTGR